MQIIIFSLIYNVNDTNLDSVANGYGRKINNMKILLIILL